MQAPWSPVQTGVLIASLFLVGLAPLFATPIIPSIDFYTHIARFFVLALAVATGAPVLAAAGGALGSGAALSIAWAMRGEWDSRLPLRPIRLAVGGLFALAAIVVALSARGVIG